MSKDNAWLTALLMLSMACGGWISWERDNAVDELVKVRHQLATQATTLSAGPTRKTSAEVALEQIIKDMIAHREVVAIEVQGKDKLIEAQMMRLMERGD